MANKRQQSDSAKAVTNFAGAKLLPVLHRRCAGRYTCREAMKSLSVLLFASLLQGCAATFNGNVKNDDVQTIIIEPPFETEFKWVLEPNSEKSVRWYQECITIVTAHQKLFFSGWPIPDNVVTNGLFSSSLEVIYKNERLYFVNKDGQHIEIMRVSQCM